MHIFVRNMWSSLGDMAQGEARRTFVREVARLMPHLLPYLEAHEAEDERTAAAAPDTQHGGENNGLVHFNRKILILTMLAVKTAV